MTKKETLKLFEDRKVRTVWDNKEEKWYFSIVDVVSILTDSTDPKQYIKKMKSRDESLKSNWGTICTLVPLVSGDGKRHKEIAATVEGILRIIQSIPSPKAEPFKQWMAHVASERLDQMQDPELSIKQCAADGGDVARVAREQLESKTGREVVTSLSAKRFFESQKPEDLLDNKENE